MFDCAVRHVRIKKQLEDSRRISLYKEYCAETVTKLSSRENKKIVNIIVL